MLYMNYTRMKRCLYRFTMGFPYANDGTVKRVIETYATVQQRRKDRVFKHPNDILP